MKEYFPSPKTVVAHVEKSLRSGRWNMDNLPPEEIEEKKTEPEVREYVVPEPEKEIDIKFHKDIKLLNTDVLVSQAEQVSSEYKVYRSLEDIAASAKVELPQIHRLLVAGYFPQGRDHHTGNTWYAITTDWNLHRYQYVPSKNMLIVTENVPIYRLHELIIAIAIRLKEGTSTFSFGNSYREEVEKMQTSLLSAGFSIPEDAARFLISKMPKTEEKQTTFIVQQNQFQW
jgi:hypothetical protein